jgi:iron-sulfur cluster assembly protein
MPFFQRARSVLTHYLIEFVIHLNYQCLKEIGKVFMDQIITITDKALDQIKVISQAENPDGSKGLRLAVTGGGCSGLSYKIEFSDKKERDNVLELNDIKILIDPKSVIYLKGIVLDFKDGLNGKGFSFDNPNAKNTCGCGESFSI